MARGAGCLNRARPDLWGAEVGNRPGLPDRGSLGLNGTCAALNSLSSNAFGPRGGAPVTAGTSSHAASGPAARRGPAGHPPAPRRSPPGPPPAAPPPAPAGRPPAPDGTPPAPAAPPGSSGA